MSMLVTVLAFAALTAIFVLFHVRGSRRAAPAAPARRA